MHIIPVIDVKSGVAVAARGGNRAEYQPLEMPLAKGSDPPTIARGYLALHPFKTLYIADLDGIEGRGADLDLVRCLSAALPETGLWVDNGAQDEGAIAALTEIDRTTAVVGSEGGIGPEELGQLRARLSDRIVLSLDFKGDVFLGAPDLLASPEAWPDNVIAMTLARVGSGEGPDLARIGAIARRAGPSRRVYAAGGIRHAADLRAARHAGAFGALVATALHAGQIKTGDLEEIAGWSSGPRDEWK